MRPTALTLNILVATLATYRWNGARLVNWRALLPLAVASIPLRIHLRCNPAPRGLVSHPCRHRVDGGGVQAVLPAARGAGCCGSAAQVPWIPGMLAGSAAGLLSGLTGTGGGIFLSPILLFFAWAGTRQASGITAPFILVNSIAGLRAISWCCAACRPSCRTLSLLPYLALWSARRWGSRWHRSPRFSVSWLPCYSLQPSNSYLWPEFQLRHYPTRRVVAGLEMGPLTKTASKVTRQETTRRCVAVSMRATLNW